MLYCSKFEKRFKSRNHLLVKKKKKVYSAGKNLQVASNQVHVPNKCGFPSYQVCSWQDRRKRVFLALELLFWVHVKARGSGT
jgi:hypothetical protein